MKATWAYAIVEPDAAAPGLEGPPGCGAPRIVAVDTGIALLASDAPLPRYDAAAIEGRLGDLDWVSSVALAHERVVEAAGRASAVVPLKLFTLFSSDARAVEQLAAQAPRLRAALRRLAGREEWGVRVRLSAAPTAAPAERPDSGTAFLRARLDRRNARKEHARTASDAAVRAHRELLALAVDGILRPPSAPAPGVVPPLLEAAYLVERGSASRFQATAEELARGLAGAGAAMELTGPWPGYSFAMEAAG